MSLNATIFPEHSYRHGWPKITRFPSAVGPELADSSKLAQTSSWVAESQSGRVVQGFVPCVQAHATGLVGSLGQSNLETCFVFEYFVRFDL